jgi:hypothetical protein
MIDQPHRLFQRQLKRYLGDVPSLPKSVKTLMQVVNEPISSSTRTGACWNGPLI